MFAILQNTRFRLQNISGQFIHPNIQNWQLPLFTIKLDSFRISFVREQFKIIPVFPCYHCGEVIKNRNLAFSYRIKFANILVAFFFWRTHVLHNIFDPSSTADCWDITILTISIPKILDQTISKTKKQPKYWPQLDN